MTGSEGWESDKRCSVVIGTRTVAAIKLTTREDADHTLSAARVSKTLSFPRLVYCVCGAQRLIVEESGVDSFSACRGDTGRVSFM